MMLADMGCDVIRIERANSPPSGFEMPVNCEFLNRGRRSVAIDLKTPEGVALLKKLVTKADMLFEGYRPGVMERLGLGPEVCLALNPKLVYGRMTGWGQDGPLSQVAGHDINYIALSGALGSIGRAGEAPVIPLNLVGDFGGGAMMLALGIVTAVPLLLFGAATRRIPLVLIGLLQYITPWEQFLLGWLHFGEKMPPERFVGFVLIWAALVVLAFGQSPQAVLDNDDAAIDDEAEVKRAERHEVPDHPQRRHADDRHPHRQRNPERRDKAPAQRSQGQKEDEHHEPRALGKVYKDRL